MSNYEVKWNSYGSNAVAYIDGPGVEALRLDLGDNIDTEAIAEALDAAYTAGREAERGDVAHWAQQELTLLQRDGGGDPALRNLSQEHAVQIVINRATGKGDGWRHVLDDEPEVKMPEVPTRYARVGRSRSGRPDASEVAAYLPGNYRVAGEDDTSVYIAGEDNSGWTLDDYVIPRLGSGLISATEMDADEVASYMASHTLCGHGPVTCHWDRCFAPTPEPDKIATLMRERDDGRF